MSTTCPSHRIGHRVAAFAVALVVLLTSNVASTASSAQVPEVPALDQTIQRHQPVVAGETVLDDGHVDIGPRLVDDSFTLLVHDDSVIPSVWRPLEDTVMHVGDDAIQTVPDDPTYAFLGVDPGTDVYVVPQVQRPGVVWVGWNSQDPEVMEAIDRGLTLTLLGVEGPGQMTMYLQSGVLGDPEVLWRSTAEERQSIWVEVNTHTHANWVFTEPGTYLVQVEVSADLVGGEAVTDVRILRFAVGDSTDPADALAVEQTVLTSVEPAVAEGDDDEADEGGTSGGGVGGVVGGVVGAAVVLALAVAAVVWRGARAKRQADHERAEGSAGGAL